MLNPKATDVDGVDGHRDCDANAARWKRCAKDVGGPGETGPDDPTYSFARLSLMYELSVSEQELDVPDSQT